MAPPTVRINTFVKENEKAHVDPISKMFIISETMLGLDRMPLIGKGKFVYVFSTFIIFFIFHAAIIYLMVIEAGYYTINIMMVVQIVQNFTCTLLSFTRCKTMQSYYSELSKFDTEAGCRPRVSFSCIRNVVLAILTCIFVVVVFVTPKVMGIVDYIPVQIILMHIVYNLEVHFFGHLLELLKPRLKLINYCIESSLTITETKPSTILKEFVLFKTYDAKNDQCCHNMNKLMDLYEIVVEAYEFLIEGIKWQLLVIIISAFVMVLGFLYYYSLSAIRSGEFLQEKDLPQLGISLMIMTPLFSPCVSGDRVHNEVEKLRDLLASKLFENRLDKSGRNVARALLALSETRDLSFRLLRLLDIDISLPFKFMGMLVTYLIIMLQFEKVINP